MDKSKREKKFVGINNADYWSVVLVLLKGPLAATRLGTLVPGRHVGDVVTALRNAGLDLPCYSVPYYNKFKADGTAVWFDNIFEDEANVYALSQDDVVGLYTRFDGKGGAHGE